jgi:hypothetical protein
MLASLMESSFLFLFGTYPGLRGASFERELGVGKRLPKGKEGEKRGAGESKENGKFVPRESFIPWKE